MNKIQCRFEDWEWPFYIHSDGDYLSRKLENKTHGGPGTWEPIHTRQVVQRLRSGDVALDIGANMGWYTTIMSKCVGTTGTVISIEPSFENFTILQENIKLNNLTSVIPINKAAGNTTKLIRLSKPKNVNHGDTRIYNPGESHESSNEIEMSAVDTLLDDLHIEKSKIRFIKIDCQGAEPYILEGLKNTLEDLSPGSAILLEIWPESWLQQNIELSFVFENIKNKFNILNDDMITPLSWEELYSICYKAYQNNNQNKLRGFDILLIKE
jgi:FkbM family methyltransferase